MQPPKFNYGKTMPVLTNQDEDRRICNTFTRHIDAKFFPCIAAKAALGLDNMDFFIAMHPGCPADDEGILSFMYGFVERLRRQPARFRSAVILFRDPSPIPEALFDRLMWQRLQALADLDRREYGHDARVADDPASPDFSYSLREEAFYVIGMHAGSSRPARQSVYPAFVFNPHSQFELLRSQGKYEALKTSIRKRDVLYSGSVNPMLSDFGAQSEARQYSGLQHETGWACPLKLKH